MATKEELERKRKINETLVALDDSCVSTYVGPCLSVGCDVRVRRYSRSGYNGVLQGFIFDDNGKCSFVAVKDYDGNVWREELSMVEVDL